MIHARDDYNRMQDPALDDPSLIAEGSTPIGKDEPVCLFRAQDKHFVAVLEAYRSLVRNDEDADYTKASEIIRSIDNHIGLAIAWQFDPATKSPDLPSVTA